jgi:serine/threonine-protein kinase
VLNTVPPANQTSAITNEITIVVGTGPRTREIPDVAGETADLATKNLNTVGFPTVLTATVDSTEPVGQVIGTEPTAGAAVPLDSPITLKVSKGNQFIMPNMVGQFWVDAEPNLRALGWTGVLVKGPDVPNSGQRTNAVVTQSPPPGAGTNRDGPLTLSFAS